MRNEVLKSLNLFYEQELILLARKIDWIFNRRQWIAIEPNGKFQSIFSFARKYPQPKVSRVLLIDIESHIKIKGITFLYVFTCMEMIF